MHATRSGSRATYSAGRVRPCFHTDCARHARASSNGRMVDAGPSPRGRKRTKRTVPPTRPATDARSWLASETATSSASSSLASPTFTLTISCAVSASSSASATPGVSPFLPTCAQSHQVRRLRLQCCVGGKRTCTMMSFRACPRRCACARISFRCFAFNWPAAAAAAGAAVHIYRTRRAALPAARSANVAAE